MLKSMERLVTHSRFHDDIPMKLPNRSFYSVLTKFASAKNLFTLTQHQTVYFNYLLWNYWVNFKEREAGFGMLLVTWTFEESKPRLIGICSICSQTWSYQLFDGLYLECRLNFITKKGIWKLPIEDVKDSNNYWGATPILA